MWKRVKDNFESGVEKVKWFASLLNERVKIEVSLAKLLYRSEEMEKRKKELMRKIGNRVYEMRDGHEKQILRDPDVADALRKLEELDAEIEDLKKKASEISRIET